MTPPMLVRLPADPVLAGVAQALRTGAIVARADVSVLELAGPGAVTCLQGLLTNDFEKPGDGAFVYGALLTPKGMIVVDGWASRLGTTVRYTVPTAGRERARAIFERSIPPRLARTADRSDELAVVRLAGGHAVALAETARFPVPAAVGKTLETTLDGGIGPVEIARASDLAPFSLQFVAPVLAADAMLKRLVAAGARPSDAQALEFARIVAGWPGLSAEVDEKTLPQEVRLDELGGVSYTKGCYTGQETVSRLHFRGHPNRLLRGLEFDDEPQPREDLVVTRGEREVGRVSSLAWLPEGGMLTPPPGRWIGLAVLRHEIEPGAVVRTGGADARVVALPFAMPRYEPA